MNIKMFFCFIKFSLSNFGRVLTGKPKKYQTHVYAVYDGKEKLVPIYKFPKHVFLKIRGAQSNIVRINMTQKNISRKFNLNITFEEGCTDSIVDFGYNVHGTYHISLRGRCEVSVGNENHVSTVAIMLIRNKLKIGSNCTFAGGIRIWGDGHAILDNSTGQVLNEPKGCITIGNHVWIGENVAITKNAGIPDDSIVGIQSVVSKKFTENHVVIAGNPAAIVKHGVSWDINAPDQCIEIIKQGGKLNNNYWN